jgi:hypothetical protein
MSAPKGNNFNERWKLPKERKAAHKKYCKHLAAGYSKDTFQADRHTMKRYMEKYPKDFIKEEIEEAYREGLHELEVVGKAGMMGKIKNFNAASWIFTMKNKMDWTDSQKVDHTSGGDKITFNMPPSQFTNGTLKDSKNKSN